MTMVNYQITTKISLDGKEFGDGLVTTDTLRWLRCYNENVLLVNEVGRDGDLVGFHRS